MKTYTEDQMKDAFEQSRLTHPMVGFKYDTFEDFIKTIPVSLSEREQPVKDGFEEVLLGLLKRCNGKMVLGLNLALNEYRNLPCKEKWVSEGEKAVAEMTIKELKERVDLLSRQRQEFVDILARRSNPTGDNKKGEGEW